MRILALFAILVVSCGATITVTPPLAEIRAKAARDWPNDPAMQQQTIADQSQAYKALVNYQAHEVPVNVLRAVLAGARRDWPQDYSEQKFWVERQLDSYRRLNKGHYAHVPEAIRSRAAQATPDDYAAQEDAIKQQYAEYLKPLE